MPACFGEMNEGMWKKATFIKETYEKLKRKIKCDLKYIQNITFWEIEEEEAITLDQMFEK